MPELSVFEPIHGGLPTPRTTTGEKQKKIKIQPFVLRPKHHAILRAVYQYHLLTNELLGKAVGYSEKSLAEVQRLTRQLKLNEYVLSLEVPVIRGKAPLVYTLSRKGLKYLAAAGFDIRDYFRPCKETEKGYLFLQHTLALNDFLIAAANLAKSAPLYSLSSFIHERTLKQSPFKIAVARYVGGQVKEETVTLIPDAFLDFRCVLESGTEAKIPVLLELDRGTIEQKNFRKKIRAYSEFIKQEGYKKVFTVTTVTVAFATTHGQKRLAQIRDWTRKELAATYEKGWLSDLFLFTALPSELEPKQLFCAPVWYQPFTDDTPVSLLAKAS